MEKREVARIQTVQDSFKKANRDIASYAFESDFQTTCLQEDIRTDDFDKPAYWDVVAVYVAEKVDVVPNRGLDEHVLLVAGSTPYAILCAKALDNNESRGTTPQEDHLEMVSYYNALLHELVQSSPDITVEQLTTLIESTVLTTIGEEFPDIMDYTGREIANRLRGIQHENGFKQILEAAHISFREATVREDNEGRDVIVYPDDRGELGIDVKASLHQVHEKYQGDRSLPYAIKPNGDLVVYSLLTAQDFNGKFFIPSSIAESRADIVSQIISKRSVLHSHR